MTINYAKAYAGERMAYAAMKRQQREAVLAHRTASSAVARPMKLAIGNQLIRIGERLSNTQSPVVSAFGDVTPT